MQSYVLGFYFFEGRNKLILIRKNRPEWQAGLLNGVGGKVELKDVTTREAMMREFEEETGIITQNKEWKYVGLLNFPEAEIFVYAGECLGELNEFFTSCTDEVVEEFNVRDLQNRNDVVHNLRSLIPLALDRLRF
jgi:8-oxo-dGTP diphosphatase